MNSLYISSFKHWQNQSAPIDKMALNNALEDGQIIFFPQLPFPIEIAEIDLLSPEFSDGKSKNISFNTHTNSLSGFRGGVALQNRMQHLLQRYALSSTHFIKQLFPAYEQALIVGRTSFRPVEIAGRPIPSYRKDDTRLHVDAFPSSPNQGKRILRIFSNINLQEKARQWRTGETFEKVARHFLPEIPQPWPGSAAAMRCLKMTRGLRTLYDHFMLHLHNRMKKDMHYQKNVLSEEILFPAQTTWLVFTDQVSHAALAGQHALEQTFYLPVDAMVRPEKSPLRVLERLLEKPLAHGA